LKNSEGLSFRFKRVTQEAVINCLILIASEMGSAELKKRVEPYLKRLESLLRDEAAGQGTAVMKKRPDLTAWDAATEAERKRPKKKAAPSGRPDSPKVKR
jgi:hypothetical protein